MLRWPFLSLTGRLLLFSLSFPYKNVRSPCRQSFSVAHPLHSTASAKCLTVVHPITLLEIGSIPGIFGTDLVPFGQNLKATGIGIGTEHQE